MSPAIATGTWRRPSRRTLRRNLAALSAVVTVHALVLLALIAGVRPAPQLIQPPVIEALLLDPPSPSVQPPPRARIAPAPPATVVPPPPVSAPPVAKPSAPRGVVAPPGFTARKLVEQSDETREALRDSLGCRDPKTAGLNRDQKNTCAEAAGERSRTAQMYAAIDPSKKAAFDGDCAKDDEWCLYRIGKGPYPGIFALGRKKKRPGWDD
ncbi:hypothetical protein [Caulobacter sp. RHG1]|uniref:hypothetical protein n=1 Tax=Caulobacter sp. (strain RHG1) TaxID=2545762 RepID=UPI00155190B6|nr:hypothetical protein [Caulobacter sp. RHG1]NQE62139.1 hypothetical protein [Caulobacter sp. RHG1]